MSKKISQLLDEPEQKALELITELEAKNGYPSHDARLIAENIQKVRSRIVELGLDPDDTTGEELYHALLGKFEKDSRLFEGYFSTPNLTFDQRIAKAAIIIEKSITLPQRWALKNTAAKALLREHPPKKVMKYLHYRSLESMLKRENICEIFLASQVLESATWQKSQLRLISKLDQTNLYLKPVKITPVDYQKWSAAAPPDTYVVYDNSLANFSLWPDDEVKNAPLLTMILLLLEEYAKYEKLDIAGSLARASGMLNWWTGMDYLIAGTDTDCISLNLHDVARNWFFGNKYLDRELSQAREHFWQELVDRYENLPQIDGIFDRAFKEKVEPLKVAAPDPAYEFAEDF